MPIQSFLEWFRGAFHFTLMTSPTWNRLPPSSLGTTVIWYWSLSMPARSFVTVLHSPKISRILDTVPGET